MRNHQCAHQCADVHKCVPERAQERASCAFGLRVWCDDAFAFAVGKDTRVRINVMRGTWCGRNTNQAVRLDWLPIQRPSHLFWCPFSSLACLPVNSNSLAWTPEMDQRVSGQSGRAGLAHSACSDLPPQPHLLPQSQYSACTVTLEMTLSQTRGPGDEGRVNRRRNATQRVSVARVFPLTAPFLSPPPEFQCMFWPGRGRRRTRKPACGRFQVACPLPTKQ